MTPDEFWAKVRGEPDECWLWRGASHPFGYGMFTHRRRKYRTHRYAYELAHGPIPPGAHVLHSCDVPACCNPAHLHLGDAQQNMRECVDRGRAKRANGERCGAAKLTADAVLEIRRRRDAGEPYTTIAPDYGVTPTTARSAAIGEYWRHV